MKTLEQLGVSPAPWRVSSDVVTRVMASDGNQVADDTGMATRDVAVCLNNAYLIAAAPELYEALAAMVSCAEANGPYLDMSRMDIAMDMARKAIRKAVGGWKEV